MTEFAWERQTPAYRMRPCPQHGAIRREMEMWSSGPDYACPRCKDTEFAIWWLADCLRACHCVDGMAILGSAMRHLMKDQHWRAKDS